MDHKVKSSSQSFSAPNSTRRSSITRIPVLVRGTPVVNPEIPNRLTRAHTTPLGDSRHPMAPSGPRIQHQYSSLPLVLKRPESKSKELGKTEAPSTPPGGKISFCYKSCKPQTPLSKDIPQRLMPNLEVEEPVPKSTLPQKFKKDEKILQTPPIPEQRKSPLHFTTIPQKSSFWTDTLTSLRQQNLSGRLQSGSTTVKEDDNAKQAHETPSATNKKPHLEFKPLFQGPGKASLVDTLIDRYQLTKLNRYLDTDVENLDDILEPLENYMEDSDFDFYMRTGPPVEVQTE